MSSPIHNVPFVERGLKLNHRAVCYFKACVPLLYLAGYCTVLAMVGYTLLRFLLLSFCLWYNSFFVLGRKNLEMPSDAWNAGLDLSHCLSETPFLMGVEHISI